LSDNEINPIDLPEGLISITSQPGTLDFIYEEVDGNEVISVVVDDARVRHVRVMFTPSVAEFVAMTLWAMTTDIDNLRRQWRDQ
jgi:hypothetical protein